MSTRFRTGLVVGKFSPLHHGHELLLRAARTQAAHVFCISYSRPGFARCSAEARRRWLLELEPSITHLALDEAELERLRGVHPQLPELPCDDAPELEHRTFVARICLEVWGVAVEAVFTSELYGDGFAAELTRQFRADGFVGEPVEHVLVDLARQAIPISASAIRADRELGLCYLSPVVRASFVSRVCVLGGESTGKTTLTRALGQRFDTAHVEEYGRTLWLERQGELLYDDYLRIAQTQVEHEEQAARRARRVLFGDTTPLTTLYYCLDVFGRAEPEQYALAARAYDLVLLCAPDVPFVQDGTRRDEAFRLRQHAFYVDELTRCQANFVQLVGPLETRLEQATSALARLGDVVETPQV